MQIRGRIFSYKFYSLHHNSPDDCSGYSCFVCRLVLCQSFLFLIMLLLGFSAVAIAEGLDEATQSSSFFLIQHLDVLVYLAVRLVPS